MGDESGVLKGVQTLASPGVSGGTAQNLIPSEEASSKGGDAPSSSVGVLRTKVFPKGLLQSIAITNMILKARPRKTKPRVRRLTKESDLLSYREQWWPLQ